MPAGAVPGRAELGKIDHGFATAHVAKLQRSFGNAYVSDLMGQAQQGMSKLAAGMEAAKPRAQAAQQIYESLQWTNDTAGLLAAMSGRSWTEMQQIAQAFEALYKQPLKEYLRSQLDWDNLVRAMALYHGTSMHGQHTQLALALIANTREQDALNILSQATLQGRRAITTQYELCFGDLNNGTLKADLEDALWGVNETRAVMLLENEMTPALELYLESVAMSGRTETAKVVARFTNTVTQKGPAGIVELNKDWEKTVRGKHTELSLYDAMRSELSGESWDHVKAALEGAGTQMVGEALGKLLGKTDDPKQFTPEEHGRILTAKQMLTSSTEGGYTGIGTTEAVALESLDRVRAVYDARKERLLKNREIPYDKRQAIAAELDAEWDKERAELLAFVNEDMFSLGTDYREAKLTLAKAQTDADKLFVALARDDFAAATKAMRAAWAGRRIGQLHNDAGSELKDGTETLRPAFKPLERVTAKGSDDWEPVKLLLDEVPPRIERWRPDRPLPRRGEQRQRPAAADRPAYRCRRGAAARLDRACAEAALDPGRGRVHAREDAGRVGAGEHRGGHQVGRPGRADRSRLRPHRRR